MCSAEFEQLTEAAEVLLDHGHTDIYSWTREQVQQHLSQLDQQAQQPSSKRPKTQVDWCSVVPYTMSTMLHQQRHQLHVRKGCCININFNLVAVTISSVHQEHSISIDTSRQAL